MSKKQIIELEDGSRWYVMFLPKSVDEYIEVVSGIEIRRIPPTKPMPELKKGYSVQTIYGLFNCIILEEVGAHDVVGVWCTVLKEAIKISTFDINKIYCPHRGLIWEKGEE